MFLWTRSLQFQKNHASRFRYNSKFFGWKSKIVSKKNFQSWLSWNFSSAHICCCFDTPDKLFRGWKIIAETIKNVEKSKRSPKKVFFPHKIPLESQIAVLSIRKKNSRHKGFFIFWLKVSRTLEHCVNFQTLCFSKSSKAT